MELKIDLLDKGGESTPRVVLGIAFTLLAVAGVAGRMYNHETIRVFDWVYSAVFGLNGVYYLTEGLGVSVAKLLGMEAFVRINDELISVKLNSWGRGKTVYWKDIESLDYRPNRFLVQRNNRDRLTIDLSELAYSLKKEVKGAIIQIAKVKGLLVGDCADLTAGAA